MAALLKKRALAEYSHVIQEEPQPVKKLRLIHKPKPPEPELDLHAASSSYEVLQLLVQFEDSLPISGEHAGTITQSLIEHYRKEKDDSVRAKIMSLLGQIARTPGFNPSLLVEDVTAILKSERSHKVVSQIILSLTSIGKTLPRDTKLHDQLIQIAKQYLGDTNHHVRSKCLDLIGALGSPDQRKPEDSQSESRKTLQKFLADFTHDQDCRVRTSAFQAMLSWHQRGIKLDLSVYDQAVLALSDDYEGVRLMAVKLIWVISHLYPESCVKVPDSAEELRLVDDGFAKLCSMVSNDIALHVRAGAAQLLGSLHLVSPKFLEQTLDKKLMSNMRRKKAAHERQKELFESGEWATGQKWADDAPKEEVDAQNVSLMSIGACGAFVHGLEDEFLEVRNAAIDSLCELALRTTNFARLSQDFLVDMFNDEIEHVRLNAITSLRKIIHRLLIREDQVDIILEVLKDCSFEIREAVHEMICNIRLATKGCLHTCVMRLLDNLRRYSQDRASVWRVMQHLGVRHPALTLPLVPELLNTHPYFDTPEPDMDDPAYISVLILVFNAAAVTPSMLALLPQHTLRHYQYLHSSLPELVPHLQIPGEVLGVISKESEAGGSGRDFLQQTLQRLEGLEHMEHFAAVELMKVSRRDLARIAEVNPALAGSAECVSMFLQCQLLLAQVMGSHSWSGAGSYSGQQSTVTSAAVDKIAELTQHIENKFLGLSLAEIGIIRMMRLRAYSLKLLSQLRQSVTGKTTTKMCESYLERLNQLQRFLANSELSADRFSQILFAEMHTLESRDPSLFIKSLQSALEYNRCPMLKLTNQVQQASVTIQEPTDQSDNPLKFAAGLTVAVHMDCIVSNVEDLDMVRIQLRYPDMSLQHMVPKASDFRQLGPLRNRLVTQVYLSHALWSEPGNVEVSVVIAYDADKDLKLSSQDQATEALQYIQLCKPVKLAVAPKPARR